MVIVECGRCGEPVDTERDAAGDTRRCGKCGWKAPLVADADDDEDGEGEVKDTSADATPTATVPAGETARVEVHVHIHIHGDDGE